MGKWKQEYNSGRRYQVKWEEEYPWLTAFEGQGFCTVCHCVVKNKKSTLGFHEKSRKHIRRLSGHDPEEQDEGEKRKYKECWAEEFTWLAFVDDSCYCMLCKSTLQNRKSSLYTHQKTSKHINFATQHANGDGGEQGEGEYYSSASTSYQFPDYTTPRPGPPRPPGVKLKKETPESVVVSYSISENRKVLFSVMTSVTNRIGCEVVPEQSWRTAIGYDGIVLVSDTLDNITGPYEPLQVPLREQARIDETVEKEGCCVRIEGPGKRLFYAPTGPIDRDYDDVRRFCDAASAGIKRALKAGVKNPLLVNTTDDSFQHSSLITLLGALHALYVPLEIREEVPNKQTKVKKLGIVGDISIVQLAVALESGRAVARDIGGSDPERMAPPHVEEYVNAIFQGSCVSVDTIADERKLNKEYPLFAAVNRCARTVPRHRGRIMYLTYEGEGPIEKTLMLVGKGVTYDTGGADIKAGGVMAGMHRDKCGSAAVAGFMEIVSRLKPKNLKVIGALALVRNSVGNDCYVADEIITSRAGVRVRVGNTDAEGRMAMADILCRMKEVAMEEVDPHLMTIATLTGHCVLAYGESYSAIMDNGPARMAGVAQYMQICGEEMADPFEVSSIRREDFEFHAGKSEYEDVLQCNNAPSSRTPRGHQSPSAFLILASGLDKHGKDSEDPLKYSHIDIAGSSGPFPGIPTGAPILALAKAFIPGEFEVV